MKHLLVFLNIFLFLFLILSLGFADIIYLKNGRTIEGNVLEENEEKVRIAVDGGVIQFNQKMIKKIKKSDFVAKTQKDTNDYKTSEPHNTNFNKPKTKANIFKRAEKLAAKDLRRAIPRIDILNLYSRNKQLKNSKIQIDVEIEYKKNNAMQDALKTITLKYIYDEEKDSWKKPKKNDIINLTQQNQGEEFRSYNNSNNNCPKNSDGSWKKEYKVRGTVRKRRRLIGPGQPSD